ncbi:Toprim-like [Lachnospiraceae bacterium XBB1006]|nr:Toprim-like [Lachnospiraceae bacterium XBB1006]
MPGFTEEELRIAKDTDLVAVAREIGFTPRRVGSYFTLKEMDSIRIYNRTNWFRWSRQYDKGHNGGSQIDFLKEFAGMDVKEAVFWLLDFVGYSKLDYNPKPVYRPVTKQPVEKKEFILPEESCSNAFLYSYLCNERMIRKDVVDYFVKKKLIYESRKYHNIVFNGNDKNGVTRFASMRGTHDYEGKGFKCDVAGNDKNYGFNISNPESNLVIVFEGAIDLMSYVDILSDYDENMVALGMLSDAPLKTFLEEHSQINQIRFCLDADVPGKEATKVLMEKYQVLGYAVEYAPVPDGAKDFNEWLVSQRKILQPNQNELKKSVQ